MWLYLPSESCISARVSTAWDWELISPSDAVVLWPIVSGIPTPVPLSWHGWRERPWIRRLSGTMLLPSQQATFTREWTSSLLAIPASLSPWPDGGSESMIRGTCGHTSNDVSERCRRLFASLKTWKGTSRLDSTRWRRIFRIWVTSLRRESLRRARWARRTGESAFSSWPTARAEDSQSCGGHRGSLDSLSSIGARWATPTAADSMGNHAGGRKASLRTETNQWVTPQAHDSRGGSPGKVRTWATPAAGNYRSGSVGAETLAGNSRPLQEQAFLFSHRDLAAHSGQDSSPDSPDLSPLPSLNPAFVAWLMGLPIWWTMTDRTRSDASEMQWYRSRLRMRLLCLLGELESHEAAR